MTYRTIFCGKHPDTRACALVFALVPLACGFSMSTARETFATDHRCNKNAIKLVERPDLQSTGPRGTVLAFEVSGCNAHDLLQCETHRYGPLCSGIAFCETPGCATDDEGVTKRAFSEAKTCPLDRIEAVRGVADVAALAPPSIASDPERMSLWRTKYLKKAADFQSSGGIIVLAKGCGATTAYACRNGGISTPDCEPLPLP